MGVQPTGKRCTSEGISVARFKAGKVVEDWVQWDALGLMRQLGVAGVAYGSLLGARPTATSPAAARVPVLPAEEP